LSDENRIKPSKTGLFSSLQAMKITLHQRKLAKQIAIIFKSMMQLKLMCLHFINFFMPNRFGAINPVLRETWI